MSMDWRGTANSLSEPADNFYSQPGKLLYSDITFVLSDGSEVQAHKLILALDKHELKLTQNILDNE